MKAVVSLFDGSTLEINVERVWYLDGVPQRVWGDGYKFDRLEEPFELVEEDE